MVTSSGVKAPGLREDRVGDRHLADIVQKRAAGDHVNLALGQAHGPGDGDSERGDAAGMTFGFGVL